jgi:hypothetical protein
MKLFSFKLQYNQGVYHDSEWERDIITPTQITVLAENIKSARTKVIDFMADIFKRDYKYCSNLKVMVNLELERLNENLKEYKEGEEIIYVSGEE